MRSDILFLFHTLCIQLIWRSLPQVRIKPNTQKDCIEELADLLKNRFRNQSGIIYTTSVKDCDQLATELRQQNCRVASYHASLEPPARTKVHSGWRDNKYQVRLFKSYTVHFSNDSSKGPFLLIQGSCGNNCIRYGNR